MEYSTITVEKTKNNNYIAKTILTSLNCEISVKSSCEKSAKERLERILNED